MRELAQGGRLTCRSGQNLSEDARAKQRGWRSEETQHTVELICNNRAPVGRLVDAAQVPLKRPDVVRALVLQLRKTIILYLHTVPGDINGRLDAPEPVSSKARTKASLLFRRGESVVEGLGLDGADGHALALDRIKAANRIAQHYQTLGEAPEPLVAVP